MSFLPKKSAHYKGDIVRFLFLTGAVVLIVFLPIIQDILPFNTTTNVLFVLLIGFLAGITNPRQFGVTIINTIVAGGAFLLFEYFAIERVTTSTFTDASFAFRQFLALIFFFALYYSAKTFRAEYLQKKLPGDQDLDNVASKDSTHRG